MIGSLDPTQKQVTVIGAGISGLFAADRLHQMGYQVTLLEATSRPGGLISTGCTSSGISESAAHSVLATPAFIEFLDRLSVKWVSVDPNSRSKFIWRGKRMRKFPLGVGGAMAALVRAYFVMSSKKSDPLKMTLDQWALRFLGEEALEYLLNPFLRGIYAARPSEICVGAAFPSLAVPSGHSLLSSVISKKLKGGPKRSRPQMIAPLEGMEAIGRALDLHLKSVLGEAYQLNSPVHDVPRRGNVVLCVPAPVAAKLLASEDHELSKALGDVTYAPLVSVTVFVESAQLGQMVRGVGVLMPEREKRASLGILFNSSTFRDRVRDADRLCSFTMMFGGTGDPEWVSATEDKIRAAVVSELREVLKLSGTCESMVIHRWPSAIPIYNQKLMSAWEAARQGWCKTPGRILFGNYSGQVSVRGMFESVATLN